MQESCVTGVSVEPDVELDMAVIRKIAVDIVGMGALRALLKCPDVVSSTLLIFVWVWSKSHSVLAWCGL
jgi:hypothetical protein